MWVFAVACLAVATAVEIPAGSYFITFSDTMERGMEYNVNVDILNTTDPVNIHAEIQRVWNNYTNYVRLPVVQVNADVMKGKTGKLSMTIPTDLQSGSYYLHIRGSNGLQFETEKTVSLTTTSLSIMVQTDKAMYKPGQLVRFRAFAIYPNLRVYTGKFDITINDPNQNTLRIMTGLESSTGVVAGEFQLADKAIFGDWRLIVNTEDQDETESKSFTVSDYQLPRFVVTVELPSFSLLQDNVISGTVKAKYTFGKPVKGMVELHARVSSSSDYCGNPPKYVELAFPIYGEAKFDFPVADIHRLMTNLEGHDVYIDAIVKEDITGVKLNGTSSVTFYRYPYKIEILSSSPGTFSPNLPYVAHIQVSQHDGLPVTDLSTDVSIYTCVHYDIDIDYDDRYLYGVTSFRGSYALPPTNYTLTPSGIIHVQMTIPSNATQMTFKAHYKHVHDSKSVDRKESRSNNYIQLRLQDTTIKLGQKATFRIEHTETVPFINYEVIARGMVLLNGHVPITDSNPATFEVPITTKMAPNAHIIAYYVRSTSEVVADTLEYSVEDIFDNKVSIAFSSNESKPRDSIDLVVTADPQSSVNLLAVDQSVRLLKTGNDITPSQVRSALDDYSNGKEGTFSPGIPTLTSSAVSSRNMFSDAGLKVITDAWWYDHLYPPTEKPAYLGPTPYPIGYIPYPGATPYVGPTSYPIGFTPSPGATPYLGPTPYPIGFTPFPGATPYPGVVGGGHQLKEVKTVRQEFPETWIWSNHTVGADGKVSVNATVPDTITSWVASAFAVNSVSGLGVAATKAKLKVYRPFFVSLTMPSSVLRGEQVIIQATVFNYLPSDVQVVVSLPTSSDYVNMVVDSTGKTTQENKDQTQTITVKSQKQGSVYFPIIPSSLGAVNIEVSARSTLAADAVRRPLYVQSEGIPKEYNIPAFIDLTGGSDFNQKVALSLPAEVVTGSEKVKVKVTGDLIGASLDSLEHLLSLPTGCGEQNMMSFAPDVYIADYLTATKQMTPALEAKITDFLELGFQRELTYQRRDGSFSPFGERDAAGSMWLTAFVTTTFHEARPYIYVGNDTLVRALQWMSSRQNLDGSFNEPGLVINKQITNSKAALTAMVLLALQENSDLSGYGIADYQYGNTTYKAKAYLEMSSMSKTITDSYTLAIVSYALAKAGSSMGDNSFNALNSAATVKGNMKYWDDAAPNSPNYYNKWTPPHVRAKPIDIQITAYALLATAARGDLKSCLPITNWLSAQRNPYGGFSTTQDTMVALKALTDYAQRTHSAGFNVALDISAGSDNQHLTVDDNNALVLQTRELTSFPKEVTLTATGHGVAYAEVDAFFNVEEEIGTPAFDISAVFLDDYINSFRLMTCTKWLKQGSSGMTVMEISIPSGFEPDMTSIGNVAGLKRVERRGRNVVVYFDEISRTSICFDMLASRTGMVTGNQDSYITVYDYYQPDNQASIFYQTRSMKKATLCDVCRDCCPQVP